jgi:tetratricopeptide (TPR) repeat protein
MAAFSVVWWIWPGLYNVSPEFYYILIEKNGQPLKLLNGEVLRLHPQDRVKILKVSTSISFNIGVRLMASGVDINALSYERLPLATLLPERSIFGQHKFRIMVKQYNHNIGYVDIEVEPYLEDWLDKAERTIDAEKRIKILEEALNFSPKDTHIRDRLIEEYKSLKQWSKAATMLEAVAKEKPDQKILFELLDLYEAMSDTNGVISVLKRLSEQNPNDVDIQLQLAATFEKAKKDKDAIEVYESLVGKIEKGKRLPIYETLGYLYTQTDQVKNAISAYSKAVELDKKDANLYYNLSSLYEKMGNKEKANFFLSKAISLKPRDMESRVRLAESLIKKGNLEEAEKYLSDVLAETPDSVSALLLMTKIFEKRGDKKSLKEVYKKILSKDPSNDTLLYNIAVLEYETGNLTNSIPFFKKYLERHPKDIEVHSFLFDIYKRKKAEDLAFKEANTLVRLNPKEVGPYYYMFEYLNKRGNYKGIIEVMENGLKFHPGDIDLREYLILAYLKTGKEDLAIGQMKEALKAKPEDLTLLLHLARLQEKQGSAQEALEAYRKVLEISPGHEEAKEASLRLLLKLARLREAEGNFGEALSAYKKILEISPGHEEAEEAYLRLRIKVLPIE